jgi:hypothetical protein
MSKPHGFSYKSGWRCWWCCRRCTTQEPHRHGVRDPCAHALCPTQLPSLLLGSSRNPSLLQLERRAGRRMGMAADWRAREEGEGGGERGRWRAGGRWPAMEHQRRSGGRQALRSRDWESWLRRIEEESSVWRKQGDVLDARGTLVILGARERWKRFRKKYKWLKMPEILNLEAIRMFSPIVWKADELSPKSRETCKLSTKYWNFSGSSLATTAVGVAPQRLQKGQTPRNSELRGRTGAVSHAAATAPA